MSKATSKNKTRTVIGVLVDTKNKVDVALLKHQQIKGKKVTYDEFLTSLLKGKKQKWR